MRMTMKNKKVLTVTIIFFAAVLIILSLCSQQPPANTQSDTVFPLNR